VTKALELHDSTIDSIETEENDLILRGTFYVHESAYPGVAAGEGWFQEAEIRIKDGVCDREEIDYPCLLESGSLHLDGESFDLVPCPLEQEGETALLLVPVEGVEFVVRGAGIEIELLGEPGEAEAFPGSN